MSAARLATVAVAAALVAACGESDKPATPQASSSAAPPAQSGGPQEKTPGSLQATTAPGQDQPMTGSPQAPVQSPQAAAPGNAQAFNRTDELQAAHKVEIDTLAGLQGNAFDQAYAQRIGVQAHMTTVTLFEQAATDMPDAEIREYANRMLPALKEHLDQAQRLNQNVASRS